MGTNGCIAYGMNKRDNPRMMRKFCVLSDFHNKLLSLQCEVFRAEAAPNAVACTGASSGVKVSGNVECNEPDAHRGACRRSLISKRSAPQPHVLLDVTAGFGAWLVRRVVSSWIRNLAKMKV